MQRSRQPDRVPVSKQHGQSSTTDYENIPTEGTFAPYSVQSITSIEQQQMGGNGGGVKYQTMNSKPTHQQTRKSTAVQSRQSSIHMPLAPSTSNYNSRVNDDGFTQNDQKHADFKNATQVMRRSNRGRTDPNLVHNQTAKSSDALSRSSKIHRFVTATGSEAQSSAVTPKIGHSQKASNGAVGRQNLGSTGPAAICDIPTEQTMPRNSRENPKWLDMPLSMEGNSNRTHRSFFLVSGQQAATNQQPKQAQEKRRSYGGGAGFKPNSTMGAPTNSRIIEEPSIPVAMITEPNQFTSISDIPATMGDQRSTTPYLGKCVEIHEEEGHNEQELISTHQLLMMSASSIPPLSNDVDSQKQTTRSPLDQQRIMRGQIGIDRKNKQYNQKFDSRLGNRKFSDQNRVEYHTNPLDGYRTQQRHEQARTLSKGADDQSMTDSAAIRDAQNKSSTEFRRKLGNLKEALCTIKTNLTSFKQSASANNLLPPPSQRCNPAEPDPSANNIGHTRNIAVQQAASTVQQHPAAYHHPNNPSIVHSCCPSSRQTSTSNLLQHLNGHQHHNEHPSGANHFCCSSNGYFSRNEAVGTDLRSRSHPNLTLACPHAQVPMELHACAASQGSCSAVGGQLSKSNSCVVSNATPRISNGEHQAQQFRSQRPSQTLNFSEIKHLQGEQTADKGAISCKEVTAQPQPAKEAVVQLARPVDDSFAGHRVNSSRNQFAVVPLDTSKTHRTCQEEATGKFVNPVSTQTKNNEDQSSSRNDNIVMPPSHRQSEQSGETIEDVHRRHQNSLLLEEYSRRLKMQTKQHQQSLNKMRKNASDQIIQPLELERLDEKNVPHFSTIDIIPLVLNNYNTIEQQSSVEQLERHRTSRPDQVSNHMSCKHTTVLSESKCQCCHQGMHENIRSHSPNSYMCYTQRDDKNYEDSRWHQRQITDDHSTMIVHESIQHPDQHARLMPKSLASSVGHTLVSPNADELNEQVYENEPFPHEQHREMHRNSSKDQHPSTPNQQIFRSISSPIIIPARNDFQLIIDQHENIELNMSRNDEKGSEYAAAKRITSNEYQSGKERQPGKIVRKSVNAQPPPAVQVKQETIRQPSRGQTKREEVNVDHDTYNQMRALKKQLDQIQAAPQDEHRQAELNDKQTKNRYLKHELGEVHNQLELARHETSSLQQKCDEQLSNLARKEQLIKDLEIQVASLKAKGRDKQVELVKESEAAKGQVKKLHNLLKQAEQEKLQLKYDLSKTIAPRAQQEHLETRFLNELLKMIGADQGQTNFEQVLKKLKKQQAFVKKMLKMVSQVEGRKTESLNDVLKWIKGLLRDFVTLRKGIHDHNASLHQQTNEREHFSHIAVRENSGNRGAPHGRRSQMLQETCLSPIDQNSHFSMNIDSSGFLKPQNNLRANVTDSSSFSPKQQHLKEKGRRINQLAGQNNITSSPAVMMNFSNSNMPCQASGNSRRDPSHDSKRAGFPRVHSQESQQRTSASIMVQNLISQAPNNHDLKHSRKTLTNSQAPDESVLQKELRKNQTPSNPNIHIISGSKNAQTIESRHSSGNWTARCRPAEETYSQQQILGYAAPLSRERSNGTSTGKRGGSKGERKSKRLKSSRSQSRKRDLREPVINVDPGMTSHQRNDYNVEAAQQMVTSQGMTTDQSYGSIKNNPTATPSTQHEQMSRRHIKRQKTRQHKQPCQTTNTSNITSSEQSRTLQTLPQNEGMSTNRVTGFQVDDGGQNIHLRPQSSFNIETSGSGSMTTVEGRQTAELGNNNNSYGSRHQHGVTPYNDVSIELENAITTFYSQAGAFKGSNIHSFEQAQKNNNTSSISSRKQSQQSVTQNHIILAGQEVGGAVESSHEVAARQLSTYDKLKPSSCDTSAFVNTLKMPVDEGSYVTQSQQQLAATSSSIRVTIEPQQIQANYPLSMQLYQRRASQSGAVEK